MGGCSFGFNSTPTQKGILREKTHSETSNAPKLGTKPISHVLLSRTFPADPSRVGVPRGLRLRLWHGLAGGAGDVRHSALHGSALDKLARLLVADDTAKLDESL